MMFGNRRNPQIFTKIILGIGILLSINYTISQAQIPCTEVTSAVGIDHYYFSVSYMGGGTAFFDFDNDGDEDLWIAGGINQDVLYENDGNGAFIEIGESAGLEATNGHITSGVVTADLDNDGYRDVILTGHIGMSPLLFKNNGDGTFSEISESAGLSEYEAQCFAAACGDVNQDGYLDIYFATYIDEVQLIYDGTGAVIGFDHDCFDNFLFINNGDWTFTEMATEYGLKNGGCALASTFTDFDQDADADLLIANDFGEWITPNALYENIDPNNPFPNISEMTGMDVGVYGMGIATGDYDQDQDLDYYITNLGRNVLLENQGNHTFLDQTTETGVEDSHVDSLLATGWGTAFMDVDNDSDLDLFVCNGYVPSALFIDNNPQNRNRLFINNGNINGTGYAFEETAFASGLDDSGKGRGFSYADYDNDGDLDMFVVNNNKQTTSDPIEKVLLFRNDLDNNHNWLKVKLEGTTSNRDAFGSSIKIILADKSWIHDYNGGYGSHTSQHSSIAHFGLGEHEIVDSLIVTWPGGGQHVFTDLTVNQMICISENGTFTDTEEPISQKEVMQLSAFPNPFNNQTQIQFYLPHRDQIKIDIYDAIGRKIESINPKWYEAGKHQIEWKNNRSNDTWYFIQVQTKDEMASLKLIYTKE